MDEKWILGGYLFRDRCNQYEEDWKQWTVGTEFMSDTYSLSIMDIYRRIKGLLIQREVVYDRIGIEGNKIT